LINRAQAAGTVVEAGMARKITVTLEDDLDGGPAVETVRFAVGGAEYEIDLNRKNAAAFRRKLAPFVEHPRRDGQGPRRRAGRSAVGRERGAAIRAWAAEQGIPVSPRGAHPGGCGGAA
jgi:hypothetical protein